MIFDGFYDIVIHTTGPMSISAETWKADPPPRADMHLTPTLSVVRLPRKISETVMTCCDPRVSRKGEFQTATRTFSERYTFARRLSLDGASSWDADQAIQTAVATSRLIYPTPIRLEYAARIQFEKGTLTLVEPANCGGAGRLSWVAPGHPRDWLTEPELLHLKKLLETDPIKNRPARLQRALWFLENAFRTHTLAVRWTLVSTGLEALVHVDRKGSTKQFVDRTCVLARKVEVSTWLPADAEAAYDMRSRISHGDAVESKGTETELYDQMESLLRLILLRSLEDSTFASIFLDDRKIVALV